MKHTILSIIGFVLSLATFAANPTNAPHLFCDFESPNTLPASAFHIPDGGAVDVSIVANPYPSGINTSDTVLKIISPSGANWGGAIFNEVSHGQDLMMNLYQVHKVTGYDLVSLLMYRENNTHVPQLKTVDIDDDGHTSVNYLDLVPLSVDGDENYVANHTIQTHKWQKVVYSVTHCHNSGIHFIYIMPDREGSSTVYVDDIIFEKDDEKPVMVSASCGTATGTTLSLYVSATDDLSDPVNKFLVSTDGNQAHAQECTATNGIITVTGLTPNTSYTFTVWAKDYAGNVSDNFKTTTCSTQSPQQGDWCQKAIISEEGGNHVVYISCEDLGSSYRLTIESDEVMTGLGGSYCHINGWTNYMYGRENAVVSNNGHTITCDIVSSTPPHFYNPLYVLYPGEAYFHDLQFESDNITWGVCEEELPCQPTTGDTTAYVCAGTNFYWRGVVAYDGDQRTLTNACGSDSIVTLHLNYLQPTTGDTTAYVCAGIDFYWHGSLAHDGDQITLENAAGCDSIVTLHIVTKQPTSGDTTAYICAGTPFYWHGSLAHDGDQITLENTAGCDSIVTLHIVINQPTTGSETQHVCAGTDYYWYGVLAHDGDQRTIENAAGCDSIITLHLIEDAFTTSDTTAYVCAGSPFYWHGELAHDGDQRTYRNVAGCDSIVTLHITIYQPTTGDTIAAKCEPMNWYEHTCSATATYTHTFEGGNVNGCDSIVTMHFTLLEATTGDTTAYVCAGSPFYWHGELAHDGDQLTFTNAAGCDSIVTLHIVNKQPTTGDTTAYVCAGKDFYWHGALAHDGDQITLENAAGCDSIVTLHIVTKQPTSGDTTAYICAGTPFYWHGNLAHDGDQLTFTNAAGCDSTVTLHITINQPTTGEETQHVCAGTPYYWYGELAQDGATRTLTNAAGCDSIVTLHLIEDNFTTSDTTATICAGTPFYWQGELSFDGDQRTFRNAAGCDSVVTLHLTVNQPTIGDTTAYICAGTPFYWHGNLAHDGDQLTFTNAAGCDSIVTLHLIEDNFTTSDTTATICAGTPFYWRGELAHDGDQLTFTNAAGCDSIVTLHLTVKQTSASDTTANVCEGEDFYWRGELAHNGDQRTFTNSAGCDSIVTLHLIIDNCAPACEDIIMRKWDDLIFIGNGEHLYVSYQWYRDGQALTGETGQYLYIMGYTLENDGHTYSARAYKADGTYIEACSKSFMDFQRSAELYPGDRNVRISPNPARRNIPVKIEGLEEEAHFVVYSVLGQRVAEITGNTFVPEWPVGYYLIYSLDPEHPWTGKLLVY